MSVFEVERTPPISENQLSTVEARFQQKPIPIRFTTPMPEVREPSIVERRETNYVPYVVVGLLGLFAFLGFLAYLRK